ncbi:MAG: haloacid dehalogenase type II [Actinomycetota bacterium]|nr:haloacid dehalogenase type II [Actinomycetota bacterium]
MSDQLPVVVFDVNETLSDLQPLSVRFGDVGAPPSMARLWFTSVLRDGLALAAGGSAQPFSLIAEEILRALFTTVSLDRPIDAAVDHVMSGFMALAVHPDVPAGVRALRAAGLRLVTLSNGSAGVAEQLLGSCGLRSEFDQVLSVEEAGVWKPAPGAYRYAGRACATAVADMVLVAVHPWDIDGAARAGMATAWLNRTGLAYPRHFTPPVHTVGSLEDLATALTR